MKTIIKYLFVTTALLTSPNLNAQNIDKFISNIKNFADAYQIEASTLYYEEFKDINLVDSISCEPRNGGYQNIYFSQLSLYSIDDIDKLAILTDSLARVPSYKHKSLSIGINSEIIKRYQNEAKKLGNDTIFDKRIANIFETYFLNCAYCAYCEDALDDKFRRQYFTSNTQKIVNDVLENPYLTEEEAMISVFSIPQPSPESVRRDTIGLGRAKQEWDSIDNLLHHKALNWEIDKRNYLKFQKDSLENVIHEKSNSFIEIAARHGKTLEEYFADYYKRQAYRNSPRKLEHITNSYLSAAIADTVPDLYLETVEKIYNSKVLHDGPGYWFLVDNRYKDYTERAINKYKELIENITEKPYLTERIIDNLFRRIRTQESVAAIAPLIKCDVVYDDGIFKRSVGETALYLIYIYANGWGIIKNFPFKEDYDPKVFDEIYQWFIDNQGKYELEPIKPLGTK